MQREEIQGKKTKKKEKIKGKESGRGRGDVKGQPEICHLMSKIDCFHRN